MDIVPIDDEASRRAAVALLCEGFGYPAEAWGRSFEAPRSEAFGHGALMREDGAFQGVVLLFEHHRTIAGARVSFVNISSWYVREPYRSLAPFMLAAVTRTSGTVYTGLTPSENVRTVLRALRFRVVGAGVTFVPPLPLGLRPNRSGAAVVLGDVGNLAAGTEVAETLRAHADRGFIIGHVVDSEEPFTFAFYPCRIRGLTVPFLVHCPRPDRFHDVLPAVYRRLAATHGAVGLLVPKRSGYDRYTGLERRDRYWICVKGPVADAEIDHFYSEFYHLRHIRG